MAIKQLPLDSKLLKYEFKTTINSVDYWFYFRYNKRAEKWVINLYDSAKNPIVMGLFVQQDVFLYDYIEKKELTSLELFTFATEKIETETELTLGDTILILFEENE